MEGNIFDSDSEEEFDNPKTKRLQKRPTLHQQNQLRGSQYNQKQKQQSLKSNAPISSKSSKEREIMEKQQQLARKLVSSNVIDLTAAPKPTNKPQNTGNKATQQQLLQKTKQRKVLNSLFKHTDSKITRSEPNPLIKRAPMARSEPNPPIKRAPMEPTTSVKRQKIEKTTHIRPKSSKSIGNLITSPSKVIEEARKRTSTTHKRPLRRVTNTTTTKTPQVYNKVETSDYWKNIRNWDILFDLNEQHQQLSNYKNKSNKNNRGYKSTKVESNNDTVIPKNKKEPTTKVNELPNTFESSRQYKALWAPLVLKETRAQILSEFMEKLSNNFRNVIRPHHFIQVNVKPVVKDVGSYSDAITLQLNRKESYSSNKSNGYMTNDLVLLIKDQSYLASALSGQLLKTATKNNEMKKLITDMSNHQEQKGIIGHVYMPRKTIDGLLIKVSRNIWPIVGSTDMFLFRIGPCNVTSLREFTALCRVDTIPLLNDLLGNHAAKDDNKHKCNKEILSLGDGFSKYIQSKFNNSQLEAISSSMKEYGSGGFTLVKGPPGKFLYSFFVLFSHDIF